MRGRALSCRAMRRITPLVLALVPWLPAQGTPRASERPLATHGTCILAGGGKLGKEIIARFVELAGGEKAHIVLIPTASESADDPKEHESLQKLWREERGAEITILHTRDRTKADDETFCAPLRAATGVWIGGGTQKRIADAYLGTRVETELMALLARGGVIAGTSAGTAIQTRTMIQEGMEDPIVATGFDFVPGVVSDQHFLKRQRLPRLLKVLGAHPGLFGIGVDESTAAEIRGDTLRVIGASKAVLVLAAQNGHDDVVREIEPFGSKDQPIDIGAWRRAAKERATWSLLHPAAPRVEKGTLLLGDADELPARFVSLAGGKNAALVVIGQSPERAQKIADRLTAGGASHVQIFALPKTADAGRECDAALARANGVVFDDAALSESQRLAAQVSMHSAPTRDVLARGGVVWGNAVVGEVVATCWMPYAATPDDFGHERGLALLPGTMVVRRRLQRTPPGNGPITDGDPHEWVYRHATRMPRILAIHVESAAMVQGSVLEVLGEFSTHVLPTHADGSPGDEREKVTLEPGTKWDLVAQKKL